jgi:hypothetical protein
VVKVSTRKTSVPHPHAMGSEELIEEAEKYIKRNISDPTFLGRPIMV